MSLINFIDSLFGKKSNNAKTAKDRLVFAISSENSNNLLDNSKIEDMTKEIFEVVRRYFQIDLKDIETNVNGDIFAMSINLPHQETNENEVSESQIEELEKIVAEMKKAKAKGERYDVHNALINRM